MQAPFLAVRTRSATETTSLGRSLGNIVRPGDVVLLIGDLGTGKTVFVQGLAIGLGITSRPLSPTFTLTHIYEGGRYPLVHADLYRLDSSKEMVNLGLEELFEPPSVSVVEWGERAASVVGDHYLELDFTWDDTDDDVRTIAFHAFGRWSDRQKEVSDAVNSWARAEGA